MLANVNYENTAYETFVASAKRHAPDVLVVQEVNEVWRQSLQALRSLYPYSEEEPKGGGSVCGLGVCATRNGANASTVMIHGEMVVAKFFPRKGPSGIASQR